ncbi:uncharacterized protein LOC120456589 isoform X2 [Drosophila santomea]|uniref:uncharacterized protein LOC120456589 isoform X2 n=1 Tax=Drosophila santomea TaxID=129105 RepID=UPI001953C8DC|nr:uncharacterized protein LOC120456589 isoform X2 [Drosophila santomea]
MPNDDGARGQPKHRNRNRSRARPCTPENLLENHLQKLLEEQELLHNLLVSNRPGIKPQLEDLGGESNYEFDIQDEDGVDEQLPSFKLQQKSVQEEQTELNNQLRSVILAEDVEPSSPGNLEDLATIPLRTSPILAEDVEPSSPPKFEDLPTIPLRRYPILAEDVEPSSPGNLEDLATIPLRTYSILAEDVEPSSPPKFEDLPTIPLRRYPILAEDVEPSSPPNYEDLPTILLRTSPILAEDVETSSPGNLEDLATIPLRTYPILAEDVEPSSPPNYEDLPTIPLRTYPILAEDVEPSSPPKFEDLPTIPLRRYPILAEDVEPSSPPNYEDLPTILLRTSPILAEDVEPSSPPNYEDLPTIPLRTSSPNYEDLRTISSRATPILAEDVDSSSPPKFEDLPRIPSRTYPYRTRNHSLIPLPITVGSCTPPKVIGQGFDTPFHYPEFVAKNERSRVKYIFSLVDSLALQMKRSLKLNKHSMAEEAVEKAATGAVPKARRKQKLQIDRVGHAKYTITVNSRLKEPKPHNQSKHHRLARSKVHSHNKLPEILDIDCEFGMEFIEKFRANKVRDESRAEPVNVSVSESGQEKQVDSADAKEKEVPQIDEECNESEITITPNSDFSSELSFLELAMAEAFKKQRRHKKKNYSFISRPSTPITRPTTPINDDVPSTSAEAKFYQQLRGQSEPEKSESNVLNTWQLLRARGPVKKAT